MFSSAHLPSPLPPPQRAASLLLYPSPPFSLTSLYLAVRFSLRIIQHQTTIFPFPFIFCYSQVSLIHFRPFPPLVCRPTHNPPHCDATSEFLYIAYQCSTSSSSSTGYSKRRVPCGGPFAAAGPVHSDKAPAGRECAAGRNRRKLARHNEHERCHACIVTQQRRRSGGSLGSFLDDDDASFPQQHQQQQQSKQ